MDEFRRSIEKARRHAENYKINPAWKDAVPYPTQEQPVIAIPRLFDNPKKIVEGRYKGLTFIISDEDVYWLCVRIPEQLKIGADNLLFDHQAKYDDGVWICRLKEKVGLTDVSAVVLTKEFITELVHFFPNTIT